MEPGNLSFCNDKIMNTLDHQSIQSIFNFPKRSTLRQDLSKLCLVKCDVELTLQTAGEIERLNKRNNKVVIGCGPDVYTPILFVKVLSVVNGPRLQFFFTNATRSSAGRRRRIILYLVVCVCARRSIVLKGFSPYMVILLSISSCCRVYVSYDRPRRKCDR